jgi:hypothetical protein
MQHTKIENKTKNIKISCRLIIEQIKLYIVSNESYFKFLTGIASLFNYKFLISK